MNDIITKLELSLHNIRVTLSQAPQDKLHNVKTRFDGLLNAYKDDEEATTMLTFLMAENGLERRLQVEQELLAKASPNLKLVH